MYLYYLAYIMHGPFSIWLGPNPIKAIGHILNSDPICEKKSVHFYSDSKEALKIVLFWVQLKATTKLTTTHRHKFEE